LDTRFLSFWQRGKKILKREIIFKNPRLPANRGFFVFNQDQRKKNMKLKKTKLFAEFAPETRFELRPVPSAPFRANLESEFEQLKDQLLAEQLHLAPKAELYAPLRRAANEAAAIAWATLFPLLVFPALFEEKAEAVARQAKRQARIYANSSELVEV
jgi:hypothetical protein